jgi:hypothetical protein
MADRKEYLSEDKVARFLDRRLWLRLISLAKGHKGTAFTAFFFLITSEILPVLQPRILQKIWRA